VETKLNFITEIIRKSKKNKVKNILYLVNAENLKSSFYELQKDKAVGVDGISIEEYEKDLENNINKLINRMKKWQYRPQPIRRVMIPKGEGKLRPLGIPTVEDKMVQHCLKKIVETIYEIDFLDFSYGFRPARNCHQAIDCLDKIIMREKVNYIIDADIKGFFDNIDHKWMRRCLEERIEDKQFLRLMVRMLKGKIMEESGLANAEIGTPQGAVISPLLANIYLHYVLDLWLEKSIKKQCSGYVGIVRYADDFIICVEKEEEAKMILEALKMRLNKFSLELSEEKTRILAFGRNSKDNGKSFDFLGFTYYNAKTRKGYYKVGIKTSKKRLNRALKNMNEWLKKVRNAFNVEEWWKILKAKIRGHNQYYGISGNMRSLTSFYERTKTIVLKWLNRRSQKKSFNWKSFIKYLGNYPLPKMEIKHGIYTLYKY